jgi:hypothetical protein
MRHYLDLGVGVGDLSRPVRPLAWARNDRHHLQVIEFEMVKRGYRIGGNRQKCYRNLRKDTIFHVIFIACGSRYSNAFAFNQKLGKRRKQILKKRVHKSSPNILR